MDVPENPLPVHDDDDLYFDENMEDIPVIGHLDEEDEDELVIEKLMGSG